MGWVPRPASAAKTTPDSTTQRGKERISTLSGPKIGPSRGRPLDSVVRL